MSFRIACACGKSFSVSGVQAGTTIECECGRRNLVPSLTELRRGTASGQPLTAEEDVADSSHVRGEKAEPEQDWAVLNPGPQLGQRITEQALVHFCEAVRRTTREFFEDKPHAGNLDLMIACALLPWTVRNSFVERRPVPLYREQAYRVDVKKFRPGQLRGRWQLVEGIYQNAAAIGVLNPRFIPAVVIDRTLEKLPSGGCFVFSLNDHALAEGSMQTRVLELTEHMVADVVFKEYGDLIPGTGLSGTVYVLQKR